MNARVEVIEETTMDMFVFAQTNGEALDWLRQALRGLGPVEPAPLDSASLIDQATHLLPSVVFIDFTDQSTLRAVALVTALRESGTAPQIIAVGRASDRGSALAALRAGVQQFIDLDASQEEAVQITRQVLVHHTETPRQRGRVLALLGARAGLGVTALAANLAVRVRERGASDDRQVALLDFGMPVADSMLYLDIKSGFHLVDAVRNLRRLDRTMIQSALTRHSSGIAVLPLPSNVADLRDITYKGAIALVDRLRSYFDEQILDLGGFANLEFVTQTVRSVDHTWIICDQSAASILSTAELVRSLKERGVEQDTVQLRSVDHTWIICDQSAASILSTAELVRSLKERGVEQDTVQLVVGRYDSRVSVSASALGKRIGLTVAGVLPSCPVQMIGALNAGKLLVRESPRSPYAREVEHLIERLHPSAAASGSSLLQRMRAMLNSDRSSS